MSDQISREELNDIIQAFANYRSTASNTEAQLHLELARAHRKIDELTKAAQPAPASPAPDSDAA